MTRAGMRVAVIALLALAVLAGGCGSGGPQPSAPAATTTATRTATPVPTPVALTSFRYALNVEAINIFGAPAVASGSQPQPQSPAQAPPPVTVSIVGQSVGDRQHSLTKISLGFGLLEVERTQIGNRAWSRDGNNPWLEDRTGSSTARSLGLGLDPVALLSGPALARMQAVLRGATGTPEQVGGQPLVRYPLTGAQLQSIIDSSGPAGLPLDQLQGVTTLWLRDDGLPARLLLDAETAQNARVKIEMIITDHNAAGIQIEPPL